MEVGFGIGVPRTFIESGGYPRACPFSEDDLDERGAPPGLARPSVRYGVGLLRWPRPPLLIVHTEWHRHVSIEITLGGRAGRSCLHAASQRLARDLLDRDDSDLADARMAAQCRLCLGLVTLGARFRPLVGVAGGSRRGGARTGTRGRKETSHREACPRKGSRRDGVASDQRPRRWYAVGEGMKLDRGWGVVVLMRWSWRQQRRQD